MSEDTSKPKTVDSSIPDPEVKPDPAKSKSRRYLTSKYKLGILREAEDCKDKPGELGALLRREGLYSSHLSAWRKERDEGRLSASSETQRGRKPEFSDLEAENQELKREVAELKTERDQALKLIEAQKKIAEIFAVNKGESPPKNRREKS
jgi:transposase-like protein